MLKRIEYKVGDAVTFKGKSAEIIKVHGFGTVDIKTADGQHLRVSGLPMFDVKGGK